MPDDDDDAAEADLQRRVFTYLETVRTRQPAALRPMTPEESAALEARSVPEIGGESLNQLDSHIGPTIRLASDLEWQIAGILNVMLAPDNPLEHVDTFMGITAYQRSQLLRKNAQNAHWKKFAGEIQRIAQARNVIAHGSWDSFVRDPDLRFGWFVSVVKKPRGKPYRVRTDEYTDEMFRELQITSNLLILVSESVAMVVAIYKIRNGQHVLPKDLNKWTRIHADAIGRTLSTAEEETLDRLFPPLEEDLTEGLDLYMP